MKSFLNAKHLQNEEAAYAWVEARIWPNGPVCPHCGGVERISKMQGKSTRIGAYKCYQCRKPFTVKVGTIFEASHVPMHLWLQAIFLLSSSKKGISSNQLHRTLGCTLKTAWFISHRVREAMRDGNLAPMGGPDSSGIVEADETYYGKKAVRPTMTTRGRPFTTTGKGARLQSCRWSSEAAMSVPSMSRTPTREPSIKAFPLISPKRPSFIPTKASSMAT
jgi:transposase-like protein